jgi:general secretion pathway protein G
MLEHSAATSLWRFEMHRAGFTLIELLIVIAIVGILAGLVLVAIVGANEKARIAVVKTTIDNLRTALASYYDDVLYYPPGEAADDEGNRNMVAALFDVNEVQGGRGGPGSPYYDFKEGDLRDSGDGKVLIDPWGKPYRYRCARDENGNVKDGIHNRASYDLWSCGPNMADDQGEDDNEEKDDISNWR